MESIEFLGLHLTNLHLEELLHSISQALLDKKKLLIGYVNIYAVNLAEESMAFRDAMNKMDIVFCDGFGVKVGASLLGLHIKERFTPPDFIDDVMKCVIETQGSVFLLGANPGVAEKAANTLQQRNPSLVIAGNHHGYFNKQQNHPESKAVVEMINRSKTAVLLIGFGMPAQEQWLMENQAELNVPVVMTVGALFDTLSGELHRAPRFLTDHGLEWLSRLVTEPRRLWRRYLIGIPQFFWKILKKRFGQNHIK